MKSIEKLLIHCWTMKDASLEAGQSIKGLKNDIRNKEECWTISSQMKKTWDGMNSTNKWNFSVKQEIIIYKDAIADNQR